jgi:hypothetical protein
LHLSTPGSADPGASKPDLADADPANADPANADVARAAEALGAPAFKYRGFGATLGYAEHGRPTDRAAADMPAFDPMQTRAAVSAAEVYPLLGCALREAREVRVQRGAAPPPVAAPPWPIEAAAPPASLAMRALRAHAATPRARHGDDPPAQPAASLAMAVLQPAAAPAAARAAEPPGSPPPAPVNEKVAAPASAAAAAAPLAEVFRLLMEPRAEPGAGTRRR